MEKKMTDEKETKKPVKKVSKTTKVTKSVKSSKDEKVLKKEKNINKIFGIYIYQSLLWSFIAVIIGLYFLLDPTLATKRCETIVCILFIILGFGRVFNYYSRGPINLFKGNFIYGIIALVSGAVIAFNPFALLNILTVLVGVMLIANGLVKLYYSYDLKKISEESWIITFGGAILCLTLGVVCIINPITNLYYTQSIGLFITLFGILEFMNSVLFKQRSENFIKFYK